MAAAIPAKVLLFHWTACAKPDIRHNLADNPQRSPFQNLRCNSDKLASKRSTVFAMHLHQRLLQEIVPACQWLGRAAELEPI